MFKDPFTFDIEIDSVLDGTASRVIVTCRIPRCLKAVRGTVADGNGPVARCRPLVILGFCWCAAGIIRVFEFIVRSIPGADIYIVLCIGRQPREGIRSDPIGFILLDPLASDMEKDSVLDGTAGCIVVIGRIPGGFETVTGDVADGNRPVTGCRPLVIQGLCAHRRIQERILRGIKGFDIKRVRGIGCKSREGVGRNTFRVLFQFPVQIDFITDLVRCRIIVGGRIPSDGDGIDLAIRGNLGVADGRGFVVQGFRGCIEILERVSCLIESFDDGIVLCEWRKSREGVGHNTIRIVFQRPVQIDFIADLVRLCIIVGGRIPGDFETVTGDVANGDCLAADGRGFVIQGLRGHGGIWKNISGLV